MNVNLLDALDERTRMEMPQWGVIQTLLPSTLPLSLLDFAQCHSAIYHKMAFADYHYHILNQLYRPDITTRQRDTDVWARAEMHCIVNNLYSALDSLGQEINLVYQLGIDPRNIHIHHWHPAHVNNCVRCRLNQVNDGLTTFLNQSLSQPWFDVFRRLYNQIKHRSLPIINITLFADGGGGPTHIMLPNDPSNMNPQMHDYSDGLEINQYSLDRRNDILKLLEEAFFLLDPRVRTTFNL